MNISVTITVKTVREMTSCITFSCMRENGPPLPLNPILFAGTWAQYSKNATPHENSMTKMRGQLEEIFISWSFRCPYHANVMNTFDVMSRSIVQIAFIDVDLTKRLQKYYKICKNIRFVLFLFDYIDFRD